MTASDPALRSTVSARSPSALLALGLRDEGLDADALAEALPQYDDFQPLGAGGMGVVWSARHVQLDRKVAIKLMRPELATDPSFAERFVREARALAKLQHPGIVGVHDFGEVLGACFLVMEFVDGTDLRSLLRAGLSTEQALAILPQLCDALQYAHEQGIVHRDVKPENILVDRTGRVKIADFGLAKLREGLEPSATSLRVLGTPHYMAPEQIERPGEIDHRADIFALGVVTYEMLTGRLPVGRFDPPSHVRAMDVRLDEVVLRSLEHDRERRYQHASEVKDGVVAIRPTEVRAAPAADEVERRVSAERSRASRRAGLVVAAGFAYTLLGGFYFESTEKFGYVSGTRRPADTLTMMGVAAGLWFAGLLVDVHRHRNTLRGEVLTTKLSLLLTAVFLGLAVSMVVAKGGNLLAQGFPILLGLLAAYSAYTTWTYAVERRIPARIVFGPRWWIHRFEAERDPRAGVAHGS